MSDKLFPDQAPTLQQQIAEVERELRQRAHVYPRLIGSGKMTRTKADWHTTLMQAVLETLKEAAARQARAA